MKKISFVSLAVSAFLFLSVASHAAAPSKQRLQGDSAVLSFSTTDATGCRITGAYLSVYETVTQPGGTPIQQTWLYVDYYSYNDCDLSAPVAATANIELAPGDFSFQGGGQSARVQKSVVLTDYYYSQASIPVTIDLTWTGTGQPTRSNTRLSLQSATGRSSTQYRAHSQEAQVAGSFTVGSTNLLAQATSTMAVLSQYTYGTMFHN